MQRHATRAALAALLLAWAAPEAAAQQGDLQGKLEKKLQEPWFTGNDWTADFDEARKRARERGKPIFAYFTRSYAP